MDIHNFKVFDAIYETGSINKAAQRLGFAQSNVTTRLRKMENEYGVQLFERSSRGAAPTAAGRQFHDYATKIETLDRDLRKNLPRRKRTAAMSEVLFDFLVVHNDTLNPEQYDFDIAPSLTIDRTSYMNHDLVAAYHIPNGVPAGKVSVGEIPAHIYGATESTNTAVYVIDDPDCAFRAATLKSITHKVETRNINSLSGVVSLISKRGGMALLPDYLAKESNLVPLDEHTYRIEYRIWQRNTSL